MNGARVMGIELLLQMAESGHGDRVALGSRNAGISFTEMGRLARGLARLVVDQDATELAIVGVAGPLLPVSLFGAAFAGVPLVPLNYRLAAEQLEDLLATLERPLVIANKEFLDDLRKPGRALLSDEAMFAEVSRLPPLERACDDDSAAATLFTSGTTSTPKAVMLSHRNLTSYVMQTVEFGAAGTDECQLIAVPPYHVAGVGSALTATYAGRRVVHLHSFSAEDWLCMVRAERVTTAMVVPTMLSRITEHLGDAPANAPTLRSVAYGGARMPRPVLERALRAFPEVGFTNAYGLTETSSTIAILGPEDHRAALTGNDPAVVARLASVGRAIPGIEIAIVNDCGAVLPPGEVGEVLVRGPQVSGTYAGLGSVLLEDGWFPTKDRGWLDAEGYLFIEGRSDDTIIRGGENIAPAEIEDVLIRHSQVRDCAVVGLPDDEWGECIAAVVVTEPGARLSAEDVRGFVRERIRGSRTPDEVYFAEELPYSPTGKLMRREIVVWLRSGAARPTH